jgi:hypothetical protein
MTRYQKRKGDNGQQIIDMYKQQLKPIKKWGTREV